MSQTSSLRLNDFLRHILDSIERFESYTADLDQSGFANDTLRQDAVIRNLEIIGEASRNIQRRFPDYPGKHPNVPWIAAYEMRNLLSHEYFQVDLALVWQTVQRELPALKQNIQSLLSD